MSGLHKINWSQKRSHIAEEDLYTPHTWLLDTFFGACNLYERVAPRWLRDWALDWIYQVLEKVGCVRLGSKTSLITCCAGG